MGGRNPELGQTRKPAHLLTLAEAVDAIYYGASCERCKEVRRVDLAKLRDTLGPDVLVGDVRSRLKCSKCGSKQIVTATLCETRLRRTRYSRTGSSGVAVLPGGCVWGCGDCGEFR